MFLVQLIFSHSFSSALTVTDKSLRKRLGEDVFIVYLPDFTPFTIPLDDADVVPLLYFTPPHFQLLTLLTSVCSDHGLPPISELSVEDGRGKPLSALSVPLKKVSGCHVNIVGTFSAFYPSTINLFLSVAGSESSGLTALDRHSLTIMFKTEKKVCSFLIRHLTS